MNMPCRLALLLLLSVVLLGSALLTGAARAQSHGVTPGLQSPGPQSAVRPLPSLGDRVWQEIECLARNVYWEARHDAIDSQRAVAAVTLNRVAAPGFPKSVCAVVDQGARRGKRQAGRTVCQFSWRCDPRAHRRPDDAAAWTTALVVAADAIFAVHRDPTGGALFFHARYVRPDWARGRDFVGDIGGNLYYR